MRRIFLAAALGSAIGCGIEHIGLNALEAEEKRGHELQAAWKMGSDIALRRSVRSFRETFKAPPGYSIKIVIERESAATGEVVL